ncbi:MAG: hypothetical protein WC510_02755 [Candidatus Omnitrophota bacterium]
MFIEAGKYKVYLRYGLIALAVFILYLGINRAFLSEEKRVYKFILRARQAVEKKNLLACSEMLAWDYRDKYGNDRQGLIYAGRQAFDYYRDIFVYLDKIDIKLDESRDQARVEVRAFVAGKNSQGQKENILEAQKEEVRVRLIKEKGRWKLIEIEHFQPIMFLGQQIS